MKPITQQAAANPEDQPAGPPEPIPTAPADCEEYDGGVGCPVGHNEEDPDKRCSCGGGTGEYTGIPDAWGRVEVTAVHLDIDGLQLSQDPRKLVRLGTFTCDTALTLDGAEKLASRLYDAVRRVRYEERKCAFAAALANGERPLESVREQLGQQAFNCLASEGVLTIERAAAMTDAELLCIVNLGFGTLERIRAVVGRKPQPEQAGADR